MTSNIEQHDGPRSQGESQCFRTLHHYQDPPPVGSTLINVTHSQFIAWVRLKDAGILDAALSDAIADMERRQERAMLLAPNTREDDWAALHGMHNAPAAVGGAAC